MDEDVYLPLKVYVFSEQGNQTLMKMDGPSDPASTTDSRLVAEILQSHKLFQPIPNDYPNFLIKFLSKRTMPTNNRK